MRLSILTDGLDPCIDTMLQTIQSFGYEAVELATGNWSDAPHVDLDRLLNNKSAREQFQDTLKRHNLSICALNCSGNQLAPGEKGKRHAEVVSKTFQLAELLGVHKVVMMSGLPAGCPEDQCPNWVISSWPPENLQMVEYQWEVAFSYWHSAVCEAKNCGIDNIALENHGCQLVYNCESLFRLRDEVGNIIGMNVDPSHLFWMGGDPISVLHQLGSAVHHIHAKDCRVESIPAGYNTLLDPKDIGQNATRSWNYSAVGSGHDLQWWKTFFAHAKMIGYDGDVSLEIEDVSVDALTNVQRSTQILTQAIL